MRASSSPNLAPSPKPSPPRSLAAQLPPTQSTSCRGRRDSRTGEGGARDGEVGEWQRGDNRQAATALKCSARQPWLLPSGAASSSRLDGSSGGGLELEAARALLCPSPAHALLFMGSHADGDSLFLWHFAGHSLPAPHYSTIFTGPLSPALPAWELWEQWSILLVRL